MRDLEGRPSSYFGNLAKSEDLNAIFRSRYQTMENTLTLCCLGASFCICYVNSSLQRKGVLETTVDGYDWEQRSRGEKGVGS